MDRSIHTGYSGVNETKRNETSVYRDRGNTRVRGLAIWCWLSQVPKHLWTVSIKRRHSLLITASPTQADFISGTNSLTILKHNDCEERECKSAQMMYEIFNSIREESHNLWLTVQWEGVCVCAAATVRVTWRAAPSGTLI